MCDNAIIDEYAAQLGPYALSVYVALLRYAGKKEQCFPSLKTLGDQLGMGKDSVIKAISALKQAKLITVKHRTDKAGDAASNLYLIREVVGHTDNLVDETDHGSRPDRPRVVGPTDTKKTHLKKTHKEVDAGRDRDQTAEMGDASERPSLAEVHSLTRAFLKTHELPTPVNDIEARRAELRRQADMLAAQEP